MKKRTGMIAGTFIFVILLTALVVTPILQKRKAYRVQLAQDHMISVLKSEYSNAPFHVVGSTKYVWQANAYIIDIVFSEKPSNEYMFAGNKDGSVSYFGVTAAPAVKNKKQWAMQGPPAAPNPSNMAWLSNSAN